jgi:hypothetical protein
MLIVALALGAFGLSVIVYEIIRRVGRRECQYKKGPF